MFAASSESPTGTSWTDTNPYETKMETSSPLAGIELPDLDNIDYSAVGITGQKQQGLSFASEVTNRVGISYFSGLVSSGLYGAMRGLVLTKHQKLPFRLRMNSMLNHSMKLGAHNGNMFAILALYFVFTKRTLPKLIPLDIPYEANLIVSGAITGSLYKAMSPVKTIAKFGIVGAAIPSTYVLLNYLELV